MARKRAKQELTASTVPILLEPADDLAEHSALNNALAASISTGAIAGTLSYLYQWNYDLAITLGLIPWAVYGVGRFLYLLLILLDDIASLLPRRRTASEGNYLSIVKEDK